MRFWLCLWLSAGLSIPTKAAELHGVVTFGGLPIPGATVTVSQGNRRLAVTAGGHGTYSFADLSEGRWTIQIDMLCFASIRREIAVSAGAGRIEWELQLLPLAEMNAERHATPGSRPEQTAKAGRAGAAAADGSTMSYYDSPAASPGTGGHRGDLEPRSTEVWESAADGLLINGSVYNTANSPFAQSPTFGNARRHNSPYRGVLSVAEGNSALDARPFSLMGQNTSKPSYNRLTASASLGGPLWIPHLVSRHRTPQFFAGYEWTRNSTATTANARMPDSDERAGKFSKAIIDPTTGTPFAGNQIDPSRISPQARRLLALYPQAGAGTATGYNYQIPLLSGEHTSSLRANARKSINGGSVYGAFVTTSTRSDSPSLFGFLDTSRITNIKGTMGWNRTLSANVLGRLDAAWDRTTARVVPFFSNRVNLSGEAGITGNNQDPVNWGPPTLSFSSGMAGLSDAHASFTRSQDFSLGYTFDWHHGVHHFKLGGAGGRHQTNLLSQRNARGTFVFAGIHTGYDVSDFLLGLPATSEIAYGNADKYFRSNSYNAFFTDDWHVTPVLSLKVGVRWEYASPPSELYGRLVNLDIAPAFLAAAPVVGANPVGPLTHARYPGSLLRPDRDNIQPRVGFAWRPLPGSSLVVRGGYGIYTDTSVYKSIVTQMAQQAPLSTSLTVRSTTANPLTLADGFKPSSDVTQSTFAVDPFFRIGYAQNWQFSIQRDLPGGLVATAEYAGIKGTHARQAVYPNTFPTGATNPCPSCPSGFEYLSSGGNSTNQSGQFRLRRRLRSGLEAGVQYRLARAIDNAALGGEGTMVAQDWTNLRAERSLSNFDRRHELVFQFHYGTGVGVRGGTLLDGWRGRLSRDWNFYTQVTVGSGQPLTPIIIAPVGNTGFSGSVRPDYTGAPLYAARDGRSLNPAAFSAPSSGRWGNAGRNCITGPAQFSMNASMQRTFRFSDRYSMDFRLESTNPVNRVTYTSWGTVFGSAQFGLPLSTNAMRTVRVHFMTRF